MERSYEKERERGKLGKGSGKARTQSPYVRLGEIEPGKDILVVGVGVVVVGGGGGGDGSGVVVVVRDRCTG
ncbi:hypothetical protein M0802_009798 [Mischocyttarus mexicanus]|nr:hypothetical protein M0802_009798 [Mischocyttarus mexicanus]